MSSTVVVPTGSPLRADIPRRDVDGGVEITAAICQLCGSTDWPRWYEPRPGDQPGSGNLVDLCLRCYMDVTRIRRIIDTAGLDAVSEWRKVEAVRLLIGLAERAYPDPDCRCPEPHSRFHGASVDGAGDVDWADPLVTGRW